MFSDLYLASKIVILRKLDIRNTQTNNFKMRKSFFFACLSTLAVSIKFDSSAESSSETQLAQTYDSFSHAEDYLDLTSCMPNLAQTEVKAVGPLSIAKGKIFTS